MAVGREPVSCTQASGRTRLFFRIIFLVGTQHAGALRWAFALGAYTLVSYIFDHICGLQVCAGLCCEPDLVFLVPNWCGLV